MATLSAAATAMTSAVTLLRDDDMGSLLLLCRALLALGQRNDRSGPTPRPTVRTLAACGGFGGAGLSAGTGAASLVRRGRDSNPRTTCAVSGFQDRCIRPLCHPSSPLKAIRGASAGVAPWARRGRRAVRAAPWPGPAGTGRHRARPAAGASP